MAESEKVLKRAVLVFLVTKAGLWLARKMQHIGAGCWTGYGGGIEEDETAAIAAQRDLLKKSGVLTGLGNLISVARLDCYNNPADRAPFICRVQVFLVQDWLGRPKETPEMTTPMLFPFGELPFEGMMPADSFWLPLVLAGKRVVATITYGPLQRSLLQPVVVQEKGSWSDDLIRIR